MKKVYLVGAGGTGSYIAPVLARMLALKPDEVEELVIIDRDKLEESNLERQLYPFEGIGMAKASLLVKSIEQFCEQPCRAVIDWLTVETPMPPESFIISCTDNHPARLAVLEICDATESEAVLCGNETFSAEAFYYHHSWKGGPLDPRVRYPELLTDKRDDPTRPPCNSDEAIQDNPQLAQANAMSASLGMQLAQFYLYLTDDYDWTDGDVANVMPVEFTAIKTRITTITCGMLMDQYDKK